MPVTRSRSKNSSEELVEPILTPTKSWSRSKLENSVIRNGPLGPVPEVSTPKTNGRTNGHSNGVEKSSKKRGKKEAPSPSSSQPVVVEDEPTREEVRLEPAPEDSTTYDDPEILRKFLEEEDVEKMFECLSQMEFLPEWFIAGCVNVASSCLQSDIPSTPSQNGPSFNQTKTPEAARNLLSNLLQRAFNHRKLLKELRKLLFGKVLTFSRYIVIEVDDEKHLRISPEVIAWISILIESHFADWVMTEDSQTILFRLNILINDEIAHMTLREEIQGQLKGLIDASKKFDETLTEDLRYWHSVIEF
ncbi:hypothetical protein RvY_14732 [Ramazzottius varieornatus]|uniref:Nucleolar protein 11 C-terminal domain-containing protein n=1 Tax=Ramazzottius varieornatus TaxID=947166 RepID=A0A1D1VSG1_RAMVA|nr:hypothetical protein RvY_14732 [Ramazzottius varieornatus]